MPSAPPEAEVGCAGVLQSRGRGATEMGAGRPCVRQSPSVMGSGGGGRDTGLTREAGDLGQTEVGEPGGQSRPGGAGGCTGLGQDRPWRWPGPAVCSPW